MCNADKSRMQVRDMMKRAKQPPPPRAGDGKDTCWAFHAGGQGCSTLCRRKYDHHVSAPADIDARIAYAVLCRGE